MRAVIAFLICSIFPVVWVQGNLPGLNIDSPADLYKVVAPKGEEIDISQDEYFRQLIDGVNHFAFDLYQQLKSKQGNLLFSPYSIAIGMNMVGSGASGVTSTEIQKALHYSLNLGPLTRDLNQYLGANAISSKSFFLSVADAIWLQNAIPLLPSFQISLKRSFDFTLQPVDFEKSSQAITMINQWMAQSTKGKISQIVSPAHISAKTRMLLTTGFYWKGEWQAPFNRQETTKAVFNYKGHPFQVEMMKQSSTFRALIEQRFDIIEIPFEKIPDVKAQLSMLIFLPKEGIDLATLENGLTASQWKEWMPQLSSQAIEMHLPKFRAEGVFDLNPLMQSLGINQAFHSSADFSGISQKSKIYLDKAIHKTAMRIDESGSDGLMTAVPRKGQQHAEQSQVVTINRPFIFTIQDRETGLILSLGRIVQP